jgi:hypothetical protein
MSAYAGPEINNSGLVLAIDAKNINSLTLPGQGDHGYADWYCFVSGTATYSIVSSGVTIYERTSAGVISTVVSTSTGPTRGSFSVTAGNTYYSRGGPMNLVVEDGHQNLAPLTMAGKQFWYYAARNNPATLYVYSPFGSAVVNFYDGVATGLAGTPTSTLTITQGASNTFTSNNLQNMWISSNIPVIATATQTGADKTILSPMTRYVYQRYQASFNTTNNITPTVYGPYVTYDNTYNVMAMNIADGGGGDAAQGLGYEYLSDRYSWGNVLSDYAIVAPNNCYIVTSYWNGSSWVVWDTHTLTGTQTSPGQVQRDGTNGPGVTATIVSGGATNMASGATLWKWEGTAPFFICINDSADDEFAMLGWMNNRIPASTNTLKDLSGNSNDLTLWNGIYFDRYTDSMVFDGSTTNATVTSSSLNITNNITLEALVNVNVFVGAGAIFTYGADGGEQYSLWTATDSKFYFSTNWPGTWYQGTSTALSTNTWYHIVATFASGAWRIYINGALNNSGTFAISVFPTVASSYLTLGVNHPGGDEFFNGKIALGRIYNRVLSPSEIKQNYYSLRGRFGI